MRIGLVSRLFGCLVLTVGAPAQIVTRANPSGGGIGGASSLTTVGAIPRVSAAGVLGESGLKISTGGVIFPVADSTTAIQLNKADGTTNIVTVDTTNGRLGIGTAGPAYPLDIAGAAIRIKNLAGTADIIFSRSSDTAGATLSFNTGDTNKWFVGLRGLSDDNFHIFNNVGVSEAVTLDTNSNVGIGTTSPTVRLDVTTGNAKFGSIAMQSLATPSITSVTPTCVPGVCNLTWTYKVVAYLADGTTSTAASAASSTALQNGTLDAANYNAVLWGAVTGATNYTVYRTVSGGTPATTGKLTSCTNITALTCTDNGLVGDGTAAPAGNETGSIFLTTRTPAASAENCGVGEIRYDTSYIYLCAAANTWYRGAIAVW